MCGSNASKVSNRSREQRAVSEKQPVENINIFNSSGLPYQMERKLNENELWEITQEQMRNGYHKWIGALTFRDKYGNRLVGTAVLISANLLLTSAHNIYDHRNGEQYQNFKFYLAPCGITKKFHQIQPNYWRYPEEYKTCPIENKYFYDYAIIKINQDLIDVREAMCLFKTCLRCQEKQFKTMSLEIYGYPKYKTNYTPKNKGFDEIQLKQYGETDNSCIKEVKASGSITYTLNTLNGHSGSPIVYEDMIIGIHFGGSKLQDNFNIGRLITQELIENLQKFRKDLDGDFFNLKLNQNCDHLSQQTNDSYKLLQETYNLTRIQRIQRYSKLQRAEVSLHISGTNHLHSSELQPKLADSKVSIKNKKRQTGISTQAEGVENATQNEQNLIQGLQHDNFQAETNPLLEEEAEKNKPATIVLDSIDQTQKTQIPSCCMCYP